MRQVLSSASASPIRSAYFPARPSCMALDAESESESESESERVCVIPYSEGRPHNSIGSRSKILWSQSTYYPTRPCSNFRH